MRETLLPCPFCGGEARHYTPGPTDHHIECRLCSADMGGYMEESEAIEAWNTRAQTVFGMTLDEVRQMMKRDAERERTCSPIEAAKGITWKCSDCGTMLANWVDGFGYCPGCGAKVVDA